MSYKETVFLPRTDFPMRGGLPKKEPEILAQWQQIVNQVSLEAKNRALKGFARLT